MASGLTEKPVGCLPQGSVDNVRSWHSTGLLNIRWILGFQKGRGQVDIITIMNRMAKMAIKVPWQSKLLLQLTDNGFSKGNIDK